MIADAAVAGLAARSAAAAAVADKVAPAAATDEPMADWEKELITASAADVTEPKGE